MQFTAQEYFRAGLERLRQARDLYHIGESYALSMYCAGLAVECLLRAFRWSHDESFEGRHDLLDLLKASRLLRFDEEYLRDRGRSVQDIDESVLRLRSAVNEVYVIWFNNMRFVSEAKLQEHLRKSMRGRKIKGDPLKKAALDLLENAQYIVNRGVTLWETSGSGS